MLLPIKWPVVSPVFWITPFKVVLSASIKDYLELSRSLLLHLPPTSVISKWGTSSPFWYLVILLLVLPHNFTFTEVKSST